MRRQLYVVLNNAFDNSVLLKDPKHCIREHMYDHGTSPQQAHIWFRNALETAWFKRADATIDVSVSKYTPIVFL